MQAIDGCWWQRPEWQPLPLRAHSGPATPHLTQPRPPFLPGSLRRSRMIAPLTPVVTWLQGRHRLHSAGLIWLVHGHPRHRCGLPGGQPAVDKPGAAGSKAGAHTCRAGGGGVKREPRFVQYGCPPKALAFPLSLRAQNGAVLLPGVGMAPAPAPSTSPEAPPATGQPSGVPEDKGSSDGGANVGAIVGGVLGTLAVIAAAVAAYWFCWRQRRAGQQGQPSGQAAGSTSTPAWLAWRHNWRPPSQLVPRALRRHGDGVAAGTEGADASATVVVVRSGSLKVEPKLGDGGAAHADAPAVAEVPEAAGAEPAAAQA